MLSSRFTLLMGAGSILMMAGCTLPSSRTMVPRTQANSLHQLELGTVIAVNAVTLAGEKSQLGLYGGGAVGAAATLPSGGDYGTSERIATAAGGVVGAIAGQAIEEAVTRDPAQEITIQLDSGRTVMIIQKEDIAFRQGDRVQVAHGVRGALVRLATN